MQRDLEALQLCRAVHPHDLDRLFQGGPAGKTVLARDHMQVIGVLQGLALGARLIGGNAGVRIRGSGLMGLPQRLGIAAQPVQGFRHRLTFHTARDPLDRAKVKPKGMSVRYKGGAGDGFPRIWMPHPEGCCTIA